MSFRNYRMGILWSFLGEFLIFGCVTFPALVGGGSALGIDHIFLNKVRKVFPAKKKEIRRSVIEFLDSL